jgi:hypothetical protein
VLFFGLWTLVVAVFLYAAYWAFTIRRVLLTPLYRREAFWVGAMGIYFVGLGVFLAIALTLQLNDLPVNLLGAFIFAFGFTLIFFWVDSTIHIARRSDPLFRDTLRWSKLRYVFWIVTIGGAIGAFITSITSGFVSATPFGGALLFGAIALLLSGRRSADVTLRGHLRWTGLCIFIEWLVGQTVQTLSQRLTDPYLAQSLTWPIVLAGAYCLYRGARSLAPVGHMAMIEGPSTTVSTSSTASSPPR